MDAAADEQLAARLMKVSTGLFPNARVVMKDRTHAARRLGGSIQCDKVCYMFAAEYGPVRILSRPFSAIPELDETFSVLISGPRSITRTIQSSQVLSNTFAQYCSQLQSAVKANRVKNLSFRKHRFDSFQNPTSRMILYLEAVIMTAVHASVHRAAERDGERARDFLEYVSEKRLLLLALLADFSDEATSLIRMLDSEDHDMASVMLEVEAFRTRLRTLFIQARSDQ